MSSSFHSFSSGAYHWLPVFILSTISKHLPAWLFCASASNASTYNLPLFIKKKKSRRHLHVSSLAHFNLENSSSVAGKFALMLQLYSINTEMSVGNTFAEVTALSRYWQVLSHGYGQWNKETAGKRGKLEIVQGKYKMLQKKGIILFVPNNKWRLQKFYILHLINMKKYRQTQLLHIVL